MPLLLLLLGLVTTVAGLVLVASGLPFRDRRTRRRNPDPRRGRNGRWPSARRTWTCGSRIAPTSSVCLLRGRCRMSRMPAKRRRPPWPMRSILRCVSISVSAEADPEAASSGADDPAAIGDRAAPTRVRMKFPALTRREDRPVVEGADASITPQDAAPAEEDLAEGKSAYERRPRGQRGHRYRLESRHRASARRPTTDNANGSAPKVFWPVGPGRDGQGTAARPIASVPPSVANRRTRDAKLEVSVAGASAPSVTVLKSGVVEGMAYTLYSDGSIEAQLPQGRLRFGSIDALRDHIESTT